MFQTLSCDFVLEEGKTSKIHVKKNPTVPDSMSTNVCSISIHAPEFAPVSMQAAARRWSRVSARVASTLPPRFGVLLAFPGISSSYSYSYCPSPSLPFAPFPQALLLASLRVSAKRRHRGSSTNWRSPPRPASSSGDRRTGGVGTSGAQPTSFRW